MSANEVNPSQTQYPESESPNSPESEVGFLEELAQAFDDEGIDVRVHNETMFVPTTTGVEIQFVEIDSNLPAANVYISQSEGGSEDDAVLVGVVFSVADAIKTVAEHVAMDRVITIMMDLLDGADERIADLHFEQDEEDPQVVTAPVGVHSEIRVTLDSGNGEPEASVEFLSYAHEEDDEESFDIAEPTSLDLGTYQDFDRLFSVLSLGADQAENWEAQLATIIDDYEEVAGE